MANKQQSLTSEALGKSLMIMSMIIPSVIAIMVAIEIKQDTEIIKQLFNGDPKIVCVNSDVCVIEVKRKWYRVNEIVCNTDTTTDDCKLEELIKKTITKSSK